MPVVDIRASEESEAAHAESGGKVGGGTIHGEDHAGVGTDPEEVFQRSAARKTPDAGAGEFFDFVAMADLPIGGGAGENEADAVFGVEVPEDLGPAFGQPAFVPPAGGGIEKHVGFAAESGWLPGIERSVETGRSEGAGSGHGGVVPKIFRDVTVSEFGDDDVAKDRAVEPCDLTLFGKDGALVAGGDEHGAQGGFVLVIKTIKMGAGPEGQAVLEAHAIHQFQEGGVTVAGEDADGQTVAGAQPGKRGFEQKEVSKLLVKDDVAAGHYRDSCKCGLSKGRRRRFATQVVRVFILKPDGIGDFVLASGALRLLARECGEENLILCVKSLLVPLARSQFPRATVLDLPVAAERKVINLFAWNFIACLPVWWRLRTTPVDAVVCLRSMRNYLETFLFLSSQAGRRVASENILLRGKRKVRTIVETAANRFFRTELAPYPQMAEEMPMEIEAHRRVVERVLGRAVADAEVLPVLHSSAPTGGEYWICAPITNLASKVYPLTKWGEIFRELQPEAAGKKILLTGSEDQRGVLEELRTLLRESGCAGAVVFIPADLVAYVDLIAGTEIMLTVDTAAAHFATALDRPTLILFSGLHRGMFGPWHRSERQSWLSAGAPPDGKKKKWHAGIAPARAAAEIRALLGLRTERTPASVPLRG